MQRMLLLGPTFFGYRGKVAEECRNRGFDVVEMNDRPSEGVFFKSLSRSGGSALNVFISQYAKQLTKILKCGEFDKVIYLGGMSFCFSPSQVKLFKSVTSAEWVAYLWDSISNCGRLRQSIGLFDRVYSFDPSDCRRYGFMLRPLFYSEDLRTIPPLSEIAVCYEACFVGSVHQRKKFYRIKTMCDRISYEGCRVSRFFYMPSRLLGAFLRIGMAPYRNVKFEYVPLPGGVLKERYTRSVAIIDSPQENQLGLTARTIEALGAKRKIITTNADIKRYDFYNPDNVFVWDGQSSPNMEFFEEPYVNLGDEVYDQYSLRRFASTLLDGGDFFTGYSWE